jgi:phasin family protein
MPFNADQIIAANQTALDFAAACSSTFLAGAERLVNLNLATVRSALHDSVSGAKGLLAAQTGQDLAAIQAQLAKPALEKTFAYSRSVKEITVQMHQELTQLADAQAERLQAAINESLAKLPAGSNETAFAVQKAMADAQLALVNMRAAVNRLYGVA